MSPSATNTEVKRPRYLYKILDRKPPTPLPTSLPATQLDSQDGFIHLSTASQTTITADLFFSSEPTLWILQLRAAELDGETRYPPELGGNCAHVYGSTRGLGEGNIEKVIEVSKQGLAKWAEVPAMKDLIDA
jgi:uncharacterized protein (DUF952 family)